MQPAVTAPIEVQALVAPDSFQIHDSTSWKDKLEMEILNAAKKEKAP